MAKLLTVSIGIWCFLGCGRAPVAPDPDAGHSPAQVVRVVVVEGFGEQGGTLCGAEHLRVVDYFDLRPYDSLRVNFTATRLNPRRDYDRIAVRIGPSCYLHWSLRRQKEHVSLFVVGRTISKRGYCAITFFLPDSGGAVALSDLEVIGWTTR